jgi:hypothetical protein
MVASKGPRNWDDGQIFEVYFAGNLSVIMQNKGLD